MTTDRQSRAEQLRAHMGIVRADAPATTKESSYSGLTKMYLTDCAEWAQLLQEAESSFEHMEELYMEECQKNNDLRSRAVNVSLERSKAEEAMRAELETERAARLQAEQERDKERIFACQAGQENQISAAWCSKIMNLLGTALFPETVQAIQELKERVQELTEALNTIGQLATERLQEISLFSQQSPATYDDLTPQSKEIFLNLEVATGALQSVQRWAAGAIARGEEKGETEG